MRVDLKALQATADTLRVHSLRTTAAAGSGHPTSCMSAADIMAAVFFADMRFDPTNPAHPGNDRFVLSKGHAAPVLYAAPGGSRGPTAGAVALAPQVLQ